MRRPPRSTGIDRSWLAWPAFTPPARPKSRLALVAGLLQRLRLLLLLVHLLQSHQEGVVLQPHLLQSYQALCQGARVVLQPHLHLLQQLLQQQLQ
jgi:hypothetical protein